MNFSRNDIQEAEVIDETTEPLSEVDIETFLIDQFDSLTQGNKSGVITQALILAELAKNPEKLQQTQQQHPYGLDQYFEQIDYEKIVNQHGDSIKKPAKAAMKNAVKNYALPFAAGTAAGMVIAAVIK